jgi:hypothetical protein
VTLAAQLLPRTTFIGTKALPPIKSIIGTKLFGMKYSIKPVKRGQKIRFTDFNTFKKASFRSRVEDLFELE